MYILGISISKGFPFIHIGQNRIESGNCVHVERKYGNRRNLLVVKGRNNTVNSYGRMRYSKIRVVGNDNNILIESNCKILSSSFVVIGDGCKIIIREGATCGQGCWFVVMGVNNYIAIGKDVMIADDVDIWASDSHAIRDLECDGKIVNPSGCIDIHNHVWIGKKSAILKDVTIGANAVVGMASVVTKDIPAGCVVAGNPARVVKSNVTWDRKHIEI